MDEYLKTSSNVIEKFGLKNEKSMVFLNGKPFDLHSCTVS